MRQWFTEDGVGETFIREMGQYPEVEKWSEGGPYPNSGGLRPSPSQVCLNSGGVLVGFFFFLADSGGPRSMSLSFT